MKLQLRNTKTRALLAGVSALGLLAVNSQAVLFQNIAPQQLVFKLANFDEGTLYNSLPLNATIGASNNPAAGVPILDAATAIQAGGSLPTGSFGNLKDDSWGIAVVTQIFNAGDLVNPIWDPIVDKQQLTIMFYGGQDFFLKQVGVGAGLNDSQTIDSVGWRADFYLENTLNPFTNFNQALGPAGRLGGASYTSVTDSNLFPGPVLTTRSTAGFLRGAGDLGGPLTEVETTFNGDALNGAGAGAGFFSVAPTLGGVGALNAAYDNNGFIAPHIVGNTADFSFQFTSTSAGAGPWLQSSQDPIRTSIVPPTSVPEPATGLAALGCLVPMIGRRRRASVPAVSAA